MNWYYTMFLTGQALLPVTWNVDEGVVHSVVCSRGLPFDFATVVPHEYIMAEPKKTLEPEDDDPDEQEETTNKPRRRYAPFNRRFLPCLTTDKYGKQSVGIKVEFSLDGGVNWQVINAVQLNYWTSLCDDTLNARIFSPDTNNQWQTRVRVTASVQLDQRLLSTVPALSGSDSPFQQIRPFDFSDKYGLDQRTPQSGFEGSLPAANRDHTPRINAHIESLRDANQDASVAGHFSLDRLWLGEGDLEPEFAIGDSIDKISGRNYSLGGSLSGRTVYPEIIQIVYLPGRPERKQLQQNNQAAHPRRRLMYERI